MLAGITVVASAVAAGALRRRASHGRYRFHVVSVRAALIKVHSA